MAKIEDFVSGEAETEQDGAFAAWLKSRGAGSPDLAEWADEGTEDAPALAEGSADRSDARAEG